MGFHRKTVRKYLKESKPVRHEGDRARPILDAVSPRIDELIEEWRTRTTKKQRITSPVVHRQLIAEGYTVGERTVRGYLSEKKREAAEVYIPLIHRPGDDAQVDFFDVTVEEDGIVRKAWKFLVRLMHSGRDFVHIYDRCDQLSFLDGHVRAFAYLGGIPSRMIYDNLTAAVKRRAGMLRDRVLTDAFSALVSHYMFEACFARPGEGHDKGGVEARGKGIRLQHMTPIPKGMDLDEISAMVMAKIEEQAAIRKHKDGKTTAELFETDKKALKPLPETGYDVRKPRSVSISSSSTVTIESSLYSLPERWARLHAMAYIGVSDIRFVCRGDEVLREKVRRNGRVIIYKDYLRELSRKPQAVRQVAPELVQELGEPYGRLWRLLERSHGALKGARIMAGVIGAIHDHGQELVTKALFSVMDSGPVDLLAIHRHLPSEQVNMNVMVPAALRQFHVESGRALDYDRLLNGGVK
jgi:transposase